MKAELKNGEIIDLEKDCGCITHDGPHWLHMADMEKELNAPLRTSSPYAFASQEKYRLASKLREMESRGIVRIIR